MADTKISALTGVSAVAGTNELPVNEAGTSKKATAAQIKTFANTAPAFAAGSASAASWPTLASGTLLTTAEAGAIERDADAFYLTTDDGNRGVVPALNLIRADSTRTFTSNTSQQAIFNSPASGTLTLETGTYLFEGLISMDTMSATNGNGKFSLNNGGTATLGSILYQVHGQDVALNTNATISGTSMTTATISATNSSTGGTATVYTFFVKGTFEVTAGGTIIPSFAQTTAAAAVVKVGSYFYCHRIGSTSLVSIGQWS